MSYIKLLSSIILLFSLFFTSVKSEIVKNIEITGNERVSDETILMFSDVNINDDLTENEINNILKSLYQTNFFKDVSVNFSSSKLSIIVVENPIIQNITYNGITSPTLKDKILKNIKLKSRSSYNEIFLALDENTILSSLKELGYYFSDAVMRLQGVPLPLSFLLSCLFFKHLNSTRTLARNLGGWEISLPQTKQLYTVQCQLNLVQPILQKQFCTLHCTH